MSEAAVTLTTDEAEFLLWVLERCFYEEGVPWLHTLVAWKEDAAMEELDFPDFHDRRWRLIGRLTPPYQPRT